MNTSQARDTHKAVAHNESEGWVGEFLFAVPMAVIAGVVWMSAMLGMHYLEYGAFF